MATRFICDACGTQIEGNKHHAQVTAIARGRGFTAHYCMDRPDGDQHGDDCYGRAVALLTEIKYEEPREVDAQTAETGREREPRFGARNFVKQTTPREREHLILGTFVAGDRLTKTEVFYRLREAMPQYDVYEAPVTGAIDRLLASRDLDREPEPFRGKIRYRYFRRTKLEGPIADLQRVFDEDTEEPGA